MKRIISIILMSLVILILSSSALLAAPTRLSDGVTINSEDAYPGFTLVSAMGSVDSEGGQAFLINMDGEVVHSWFIEPLWGTTRKLLKDGTLIYAGRRGSIQPESGEGYIREYSWDGELVWEYSNPALHHDVYKLENGNYLAARWVKIPQYLHTRIKGGIAGTEGDGQVIYGEELIEIDYETKEVIWSWTAHEQLRIEDFPLPNLESRKEWPRFNGITLLPEKNALSDNEVIIVSFRNVNTLIGIERGTDNVVWSYGPGEISRQHDPVALSEDRLLLFDNGIHKPATANVGGSPFSRVIEIIPSENRIEREYYGGGYLKNEFLGAVASGAQLLPNGNLLITESPSGRIFEVSGFIHGNTIPDTVWEYVYPYPTHEIFERSIFKATRYTENIPKLARLSLYSKKDTELVPNIDFSSPLILSIIINIILVALVIGLRRKIAGNS